MVRRASTDKLVRKVRVKAVHTPSPPLNKTGELVTTDMEKSEVPNNILASILIGNHSSPVCIRRNVTSISR